MEKNVYGQPLAINIVLKTLKGFLAKKDSKKPLVMSFHGTTGVGKNFITQMIADNLYKNSTHSKYTHYYHANNNFPDPEKVSEYKELLRNDIMAFAKLCDRSLFVFDEVHQMPPGILDAIKSFLDYHNNIGGVDFRKNIFIFL
ncbi:torsin-1B-like, partial [Uloborus diversus]|uniref:torsin-1B-like n=1 Tax=Uloborus diversus TaxID=327109 RepID=UPI00240A2BE0